MNLKDKKLWIGIIILVVLIIFFYPKEYARQGGIGGWHEGKDCSCIGFKYTQEPMISDGYVKYFCAGVLHDCKELLPEECNWMPSACAFITGKGYYYNQESEKCEYFSHGNSCSPPPFDTLEECKNVCEN